jgi:hypothetical protein
LPLNFSNRFGDLFHLLLALINTLLQQAAPTTPKKTPSLPAGFKQFSPL